MSSNEDIAQLLSDPDFRQWISHPTDALNNHWHVWLLSHPEQEENFYLAKEIVQSFLEEGVFVSDDTAAYNIEGILDKTIRKSSRLTLDFSWLSIAAILLLVAALSVYSFRNFNMTSTIGSTAQGGVRWLQFTNSGKEPGHIILPDGSTVIVLPDSKIAYPEKFSDTLRGIELTGEAFFEVTKDAQRPFVVSSAHLKTRVVGTSFRVRDAANQAPLVRVKTGTVTVNFNARQDSRREKLKSASKNLVLQAHQEATFNNTALSSLPIASNVNASTFNELPIETNHFTYRRTPVSEVFENLKSAYGINIKYDSERLKFCSLTARLGDQPLMEKLRMVCLGLNLHFTIEKNNLVVISGDGCN